MNNGLMQIGELAKHTGVSHRTIHYYESLGLIAPALREGSGYRYYDQMAIKRLERIAILKGLGLSLDEIASVIDLYFEDATGIQGKRKVVELLKEQLAKADQQLKELEQFRLDLQKNILHLQSFIDAAGQIEKNG